MSWGPWIEHDHSGIPVPLGTVVHRVFDQPFDVLHGRSVSPTEEYIGPLRSSEIDSWSGGWVFEGIVAPRVVRYRVKRPAAFDQLVEIAKGVRPVETPTPDLAVAE